MQLPDGTYMEDILTYSLICGGEVVGTVTNDLAPIIGKGRKPFRADIGSDKGSKNGTVMVGDASKFPNATIEVHIKIEPVQSSGAGASVVSDTSSVFDAESRSSPRGSFYS